MGNNEKTMKNNEYKLNFVTGKNFEKMLELTFNELFYLCESKNHETIDSKPFWLLNAYYKFVRIVDNNSKGINKNQILTNLAKDIYINGYIFFGSEIIKKAFKAPTKTKHTKVA